MLQCGVCETENTFFRLKRDIANPVKQEGDGHALGYKWGKPGFDENNPLDFFWGMLVEGESYAFCKKRGKVMQRVLQMVK